MEITLDGIHHVVEGLQKEVIGEPMWDPKLQVFCYKNITLEVASILKAIRAAHGLRAMEVLCENGLFIDQGVIYRCIIDSIYEIHFLLELYPEKSAHVEKFIKAFSETTIDNHLNQETHFPAGKAIRKAAVRSMALQEDQAQALERMERIYKTFCGYTHANYAHIMEVYGGKAPNLSFNLKGVPSEGRKRIQREFTELALSSLSYALRMMAVKFEIKL